MIHADKVGQKMLDDIRKHKDEVDWNVYEEQFIYDMQARTYAALSARQKSMVEKLHDKLIGRQRY